MSGINNLKDTTGVDQQQKLKKIIDEINKINSLKNEDGLVQTDFLKIRKIFEEIFDNNSEKISHAIGQICDNSNEKILDMENNAEMLRLITYVVLQVYSIMDESNDEAFLQGRNDNLKSD